MVDMISHSLTLNTNARKNCMQQCCHVSPEKQANRSTKYATPKKTLIKRIRGLFIDSGIKTELPICLKFATVYENMEFIINFYETWQRLFLPSF